MEKWPIESHYGWNSTRSQQWMVSSKISGTGMRRTKTNQTYPTWRIGFSMSHLSDEEEKILHGFVALHKGTYKPFLWKDPDYHHEDNRPLVSLGNNKYQAMIIYNAYSQPAPYIEDVKIYLDGIMVENSEYTINDGVVIFKRDVEGKLTASYDYYLKVALVEEISFMTVRVFKDCNDLESCEVVTVL
jgi:hypothetical protein